MGEITVAEEETQGSEEFDLYIDFVEGRGSPSRVFHSMGDWVYTARPARRATAS